MEDVVLVPKIQNVSFHVRQVNFGRDRAIHPINLSSSGRLTACAHVLRDDTRVAGDTNAQGGAAAAGFIRVAVRVRPGSSRVSVGGRFGEALIVAVGAAPVDGQANKAACAALAKAVGVARSDVSVISGLRSRNKIVEIRTTTPAQVRATLDDLMGPTGVSGQAQQRDLP